MRDKLKKLNLETKLHPAYSELFEDTFNKIDYLQEINKGLQEIQAKIM